jgi:hypothetical protein
MPSDIDLGLNLTPAHDSSVSHRVTDAGGDAPATQEHDPSSRANQLAAGSGASDRQCRGW